MKQKRGITLGTFSIALIAMSIALILSMIKIYISNRIYHESRAIRTVESQVAALREEHSILQMNVERLRYKNRVEDTIFPMDETPDDSPDEGRP